MGPSNRPADGGAAGGPFHDLDRYLELPRVSSLRLSPDGARLVVSVATLDPDRTRYVTALWEVDPDGRLPARRLTRSAEGEAFGAFTGDGTLLFTSARPDPDAVEDPPARGRPGATPPGGTHLWALPPTGEASVLASRPGGFTAVAAARHAPVLWAVSDVLPGACEDPRPDPDDHPAGPDGPAPSQPPEGSDDPGTDAERRRRRRDARVTAVLHDSHPVRYWDSDLGPAAPRLFAGRLPAPHPLEDPPLPSPDPAEVDLRDLTGHLGHRLRRAEIDAAPDGSALATTWQVPEPGGSWHSAVALVDPATGDRRLLLDDPACDYASPRFSPDGSTLAVLVETRPTPEVPPSTTLAVVALDSADPASPRVVTSDWDRDPGEIAWTPDGTAVLVTADHEGRRPVFRVDLGDGRVTQLTGDAAAYHDVHVAPDGERVYALRSGVDAPPAPVWFDALTPDQEPAVLPGPAGELDMPGRLEELHARGTDGTLVRAWLCLPSEPADPDGSPLAVVVHGGPLASSNDWSWRWCPWLLVARGYAVVLPDFALSTGYGTDFVGRGWGAWGGHPYTDSMAVTDAAVAHPEVDGSRTAIMGGSFGGYLTNWILGCTDRFAAAVTHASLYALDQFGPTTDAAHYWRRELTPEMERRYSPHVQIDAWRTPTLVIHGDRDYRVPVGEAVRLWWDLAARHQGDDGTMPHRFLYFPDEHHWVLAPQHAKLWNETVLAFLDHHLRGRPWVTPDLLR